MKKSGLQFAKNEKNCHSDIAPEWQEKMKKIENCKECGKCRKKCPYGLDIPSLLKKNYEDYRKILRGEISLD